MLNKENIKNILYSIFFISLCLYLGKFTAYFLSMLPASLYGLIYFTLLLHSKIVSAEKIKKSIEWALSNMGLCFVPAGVGIIDHFELIANHGISIFIIIIVSTLILLSFVGFFFQYFTGKSQSTLSEKQHKSI